LSTSTSNDEGDVDDDGFIKEEEESAISEPSWEREIEKQMITIPLPIEKKIFF